MWHAGVASVDVLCVARQQARRARGAALAPPRRGPRPLRPRRPRPPRLPGRAAGLRQRLRAPRPPAPPAPPPRLAHHLTLLRRVSDRSSHVTVTLDTEGLARIFHRNRNECVS